MLYSKDIEILQLGFLPRTKLEIVEPWKFYLVAKAYTSLKRLIKFSEEKKYKLLEACVWFRKYEYVPVQTLISFL